MTVVHATNTYNVEATINAYFKAAFTAMTRPSFLPTLPTFAENTPEVKANFPAFSFVHLPAGSLDIYQGRNVTEALRGMRSLGILDLSAWTSRGNGNSFFMSQLRFMQGMIETAYIDSRGGIVIKDYATSATNPQNTAFRVTLVDLDVVGTAADANPDVERRRALVKYQWDMRSQN